MGDRVCVVRGALSFVLRASRVFGLTPLRFTPLRNGYSISVSPFYFIYGYTITTIIFIFGFFAFFLDVKVLLEAKIFKIKLVSYWGWQMDLIIFLSNTALKYCITKARMRNMILHLNTIEKIKSKIYENYTPESIMEGTKIKIALLFLIAPTILTVLDVLYVYNYVDSVNNLLCIGIVYITIIMALFVEIQMALINLEVRAMFQLMNTKLLQLVTLEHISDSRIVSASVRSLSHCYVSGCEVVNRINKANGIYMARLFLIWIGFVIFTGVDMGSQPSDLPFIIHIYVYTVNVLWIIYIKSKAVVFMESCYRITKEVRDMKVLLSQLMYRETQTGAPLSLEMDVLFKETLLNAPEFAPLGIFTINRSLIVAICSYITTYLVLLIQFKCQ